MAWVPSRKRFLVVRAEEEEAGPREHFLLDPETRKTEAVQGEFSPWEDATIRPLQPSSRPGLFWAARTEEGPTLELGLYDPDSFRFETVERYPHLSAGSEDIWVVESRGEVFVRMDEDVLALPLRGMRESSLVRRDAPASRAEPGHRGGPGGGGRLSQGRDGCGSSPVSWAAREGDLALWQVLEGSAPVDNLPRRSSALPDPAEAVATPPLTRRPRVPAPPPAA